MKKLPGLLGLCLICVWGTTYAFVHPYTEHHQALMQVLAYLFMIFASITFIGAFIYIGGLEDKVKASEEKIGQLKAELESIRSRSSKV